MRIAFVLFIESIITEMDDMNRQNLAKRYNATICLNNVAIIAQTLHDGSINKRYNLALSLCILANF
jgi:hypothetical protein